MYIYIYIHTYSYTFIEIHLYMCVYVYIYIHIIYTQNYSSSHFPFMIHNLVHFGVSLSTPAAVADDVIS